MIDAPPSRKTYFLPTLVCWLVIIGIVGFILVKNTLAYRTAADRPLTSLVPAPDVSLEITSRMLIGQTNLLSRLPAAPDPAVISRQRKRMIAAIDAAAVTLADKLNAIAVIGELDGSESAIHRLDQLQPQLAPNPLLAGDAGVLRGIYMHGTESVTPSQRQGLLQRHEWFGQLALAFGLAADDPQRKAILDATVQTTIILGVFFIAMLLALGVGVVLLIVGGVLFKKGRIRLSYSPAQPSGPPAFLETFALWLGLWVGLSYILRFLGAQLGIFRMEIFAAFLSLAVALWPLCRGVEWSQLRMDLGWHVGQGALKEILFGVIGYLAGWPILAVGFGITAILIRVSASHPTHPILRELMSGASTWSLLGIYVAACLLAPLIEETMFRGALYGHLRRRHRPIVSAFVVSFIFAAIHPQGWPVIPLLGSIAFVLAMLREWRGSLLASMTAHAVNNAVGVTIVLLLLR